MPVDQIQQLLGGGVVRDGVAVQHPKGGGVPAPDLVGAEDGGDGHFDPLLPEDPVRLLADQSEGVGQGGDLLAQLLGEELPGLTAVAGEDLAVGILRLARQGQHPLAAAVPVVGPLMQVKGVALYLQHTGLQIGPDVLQGEAGRVQGLARVGIDALPGVDPAILDPRDTYADTSAWEEKAKDLAARFNKNFAKYEGNEAGKALVAAGPQL